MHRHASTTPAKTRTEIIERLANQASAVAALLSVFDMLTATGQKTALVDLHERSVDASIDLSALIGGVAA